MDPSLLLRHRLISREVTLQEPVSYGEILWKVKSLSKFLIPSFLLKMGRTKGFFMDEILLFLFIQTSDTFLFVFKNQW